MAWISSWGEGIAALKKRFGVMLGVLMAQGFTTLAGALAGLLVVRALSTEAYARYSLALAVLGAITLLADSGTTMGAMAQGGKVWRDPRRLGTVMEVARTLRVRFGLWAGGLAVPILAWLLRQHGAAAWEVAGWVVVVCALFVLNLQTSLLEVPLKLHQALRVTQGVAVGQSMLRLGAVAAGVCLWPVGWVAALAGGLPQAWGNWRLARAGEKLVASGGERLRAKGEEAGATEAERLEVRVSIMEVVRRALPGGIYYVVSQQAGLWFLSVGGTTLAVAQWGALSRIALLVGVVGALAQAVWVPRFARLADEGMLRAAFFSMLGYALLLCLPLAALAAVWPTGLLWLVGPAYAGLESSLRLAVLAAVLQTMGGVALQLVYGRGWLPSPVLGIGSAVAVQAVSVWLGNVRTLDGALWLGVAMGLQTLVVHAGYLIFRTKLAPRNPCASL